MRYEIIKENVEIIFFLRLIFCSNELNEETFYISRFMIERCQLIFFPPLLSRSNLSFYSGNKIVLFACMRNDKPLKLF